MRQVHSTYRGWTIWTKNVHGWWLATQVGHTRLMADTLAGLRALIRDRG